MRRGKEDRYDQEHVEGVHVPIGYEAGWRTSLLRITVTVARSMAVDFILIAITDNQIVIGRLDGSLLQLLNDDVSHLRKVIVFVQFVG